MRNLFWKNPSVPRLYTETFPLLLKEQTEEHFKKEPSHFPQTQASFKGDGIWQPCSFSVCSVTAPPSGNNAVGLPDWTAQ